MGQEERRHACKSGGCMWRVSSKSLVRQTTKHPVTPSRPRQSMSLCPPRPFTLTIPNRICIKAPSCETKQRISLHGSRPNYAPSNFGVQPNSSSLQVLKSSGPQVLRSSRPQVLRSSGLQVLRSTMPETQIKISLRDCPARPTTSREKIEFETLGPSKS